MFTYLKNLLRARTHATHSSDAGTRPLELSDEALRFALELLLDFVLAPLPSNE